MSPEFLVLYNVLIARYLCVHPKQISSINSNKPRSLTWLQHFNNGRRVTNREVGSSASAELNISHKSPGCEARCRGINTRGTFHSSVSHSPPPSGEVRNGGSLFVQIGDRTLGATRGRPRTVGTRQETSGEDFTHVVRTKRGVHGKSWDCLVFQIGGKIATRCEHAG